MKHRGAVSVLSLMMGIAFGACAQQPAASAAASGTSTNGFKGTINLDVRNSVADWTPYTPKKAPEGAPNFLFILYDDTGLAAWSPYGGRINPQGTQMTPLNPLPKEVANAGDYVRPWDSLNADEKKLFARLAEVYVA